MIRVIDTLELKINLYKYQYEQVPETLIDTIINDESLLALPRAMNIMYLMQLIAYTPHVTTENNIPIMRTRITNLITSITNVSHDTYTEDEFDLLLMSLLARNSFNNPPNLDNYSTLIAFIEEIKTLLAKFNNYTEKDGIFLAIENLKIGLLKMYNLLFSADENIIENYYQEIDELIQSIRANQESREELLNTLYQIEVWD